jgi:hypothetical protein
MVHGVLTLVLIALITCLVGDVWADTSTDELGENILVVLVGIVAVPASVFLLLVGLGDLTLEEPSENIALWGTCFGATATAVGIKLFSMSTDNYTAAIVATSVGAACTLVSIINMVRATSAVKASQQSFDISPSVWIDPDRHSTVGLQFSKRF